MKPGRLALVVGALVLAPVAFAGAPVESELRGAEGRASGATFARASEALLDLAPVATATAVEVAWGRASGWRMWEVYEETAPAGVFLRSSRVDADNATWSFGPGNWSLACAAECALVLLAPQAGAVGFRAPEGLRYAPLAQAAGYGAGPRSSSFRDNFYVEFPAGTPAISPTGAAEGFAEGSVLLFVFGAQGDLATEGRSERVATGWRTLSSDAVSARTEKTFVVLRLEEARVSHAPTAGLRLLGPEARATIEGTLALATASGWIRYGGERVEVAREPVAIAGALSLDVAGSALLLAAEPRARASGEAESVRVGARTLDAPRASLAAPSAGAAIGLGALLLALAALLWRFVPWAALYSRIRREEVLLNPNRRRIFEAVAASPGVGVADLSRSLAMAEGVVRYHLDTLERKRLVVTRKADATRAVFAAEALPADWTPTPRGARHRVAASLAQGAPLTQGEIATRAGVSQRLASYHLERLREEGAVEVEEGRPKRYRLRIAAARTPRPPTTSPEACSADPSDN